MNKCKVCFYILLRVMLVFILGVVLLNVELEGVFLLFIITFYFCSFNTGCYYCYYFFEFFIKCVEQVQLYYFAFLK